MKSSLKPFQLNGRVAVVTGSRRGIGRAIAVGLAKAGAAIISLDRNRPDETSSQILELGGRHAWKCVDLETVSSQILDSVIANIFDEYGRLDILVNNAGVCLRHPALSFPETEWDKTMKINLTTAWLLSQAVARRMADQGRGKIINIASMLSFQGGINVPAYAATKHGILAVTRALANELACQGINVNAIAPGYIQTDLTSSLFDDEQRSKDLLSRIPANRWGRPEDIQGACVFLASSASDYVNGACIPVDGGWLSA